MTNYRNFTFKDERYLIIRVSQTFSRTASGKSWRSKPDEIQTEAVSAENYTNYINAIPFFNNWGDGAYCRAAWTYTMAGYLPTTVTTVSPYRETKIITYFRFRRETK
ncbi:MAG: hypothetical protein HPZ00_06220 [Christensenellaceae bacterium]|nr:hypothetical protein [Christensenellaceae bacterium]DAS00382.1 MAG TPA: hypothetical protein [Bacteriophage sp.]